LPKLGKPVHETLIGAFAIPSQAVLMSRLSTARITRSSTALAWLK
jgi:hypothetical protein